MKSEIPRMGQLEGVKMMAYQHIQQNKVKLMNRVSYLLMQHIVEQYQMNEYFRFSMAGSVSAARQIISDSIEMCMQQKIQNKQAKSLFNRECTNNNEQNQMNCTHQIQLADLVQKNREFGKENEVLRGSYEKERRKVIKLLQKYNCLSDIMLETKEKNKQLVTDITNNYEEKIQQINSTNIELREQIARLDVTIQFLTKSGTHFHHIFAKSPTQNTMSCGNYDEKVVFSDFSLGIHKVLDVKVSLNRNKDLNLQSLQCQYTHLPKKCNRENKWTLNSVYQQKIQPQIRLTSQAQTQPQYPQALLQIQNHLKAQSQQSTSLDIVQEENNKIELGIQTQQIQSEQLISYQNELKILTHLCDTYQTKLEQYKLDLKVLLSQKMQLVKISNKCFEDIQRNTEHWTQQIHKLDVERQELWDRIQQIQKQKIDLLNLIQQYQLNASHSLPTHEQIKTIENLYAHSDLTDESSNQLRKDHHIYFEFNANEPYLQKTTNLSQNMQAYILKQTISRYFLQLMDNNCMGEKKLVLLHQIGECLGWQPDHYERLEFYQQRVRLKNEMPSPDEPEVRDKANFKEKFYRFLTNESETEE